MLEDSFTEVDICRMLVTSSNAQRPYLSVVVNDDYSNNINNTIYNSDEFCKTEYHYDNMVVMDGQAFFVDGSCYRV